MTEKTDDTPISRPASRNGSRSMLLAVEDTEFLLRDEMRAIRFALEYGKAELAPRGYALGLYGIEDTPENCSKFLASISLGRLCEPNDVAEAALHFAAADYIIDVELPVDGGRMV